MEIKHVLEQRQTTHGDFQEVARTSGTLRNEVRRSGLSFVQKEALNMICSKLARITHGNPDETDHWRDIAGYASLVVQELEKADTKDA